MKRITALLISVLVFASCATTRYISEREVDAMDEISYILYNNYPDLHEYYMEGVMDVLSLKEVTLEDGTTEYKVKTRYIRYYYPNRHDKMEAIKQYFPDIYQMYLNGVVDIINFYKYVDREDGLIKHHISIRRIYDFYYTPWYGMYPGTRLYYRPRPVPPVKPVPAPKPHRRGR